MTCDSSLINTLGDPNPNTVEPLSGRKSGLPAPCGCLPHLLSPERVASALGVSERTLERWRCIGEGPRFVKLTRNVVRYTNEDVANFVAAKLKDNTI